MDKLVLELAFDVLGVPVELEKRLLGGKSNYTYVVKADQKLYTFRIPGKNAEYFVDRHHELNNIKVSEALNLNNKTLHFDTQSGHKMSHYIEGDILSELDELDENILEQVASSLHTLHSGPLFDNDYKPFDRLEKYEDFCIELGYHHANRYEDLKARLLKHHANMAVVDHVACHCDFQCSNLILGKDRLYVTDWEYSGNNDPFYDIACFCDPKIENGQALLEAYLKRKPTSQEFDRLYLWRTFQALQWHNVAMFKHLIGLSEDLKIDFAFFANKYLDLTELLLDKVEKKG